MSWEGKSSLPIGLNGANPRVNSMVVRCGSGVAGVLRTEAFLAGGVLGCCPRLVDAAYPIINARTTRAGIGQSLVQRIWLFERLAGVVAGWADVAEGRGLAVELLLGGRMASFAQAFMPGVQ